MEKPKTPDNVPLKRLLLLRHAKSDWSSGCADEARPLAERGRRAAPLIGSWLAEAGLVPDLALVSPAARTRQTWDLVGPLVAPQADVQLKSDLYLAAAGTILKTIRATAEDIRTLLVLGHNPGLEDLASLLLDDRQSAAAQRLLEKFPTAGLAVFALANENWADLGPGSCQLEAFVVPRSLLAG